LFAQTTLNIAPAMRDDLPIAANVNNIAVSITALFSGIFIVIAGGLADRVGRLKLTRVGIALNIVGSLLIAVSPAGTAAFLMIGRVVQGLSAACIMPATLALVKAYFDGEERQRALSFWSVGSWGGSGLSPLFGGFVASTIGWRWIFWASIVVALISLVLLRGTPESKAETTTGRSFDWTGVTAFVIAMVSLNILIGQGSALGWLSPTALVLAAACVAALAVFLRIEAGNANAFVDLALFRNSTFSGATLSNFLLNGAAGTLLVVLTLSLRRFVKRPRRPRRDRPKETQKHACLRGCLHGRARCLSTMWPQKNCRKLLNSAFGLAACPLGRCPPLAYSRSCVSSRRRSSRR
jgi:DHA2 family multidrug resistance protein-like MFS transporter